MDVSTSTAAAASPLPATTVSASRHGQDRPADVSAGHRVSAGRDGWTIAPSSLPGAALHHGYRLRGTPTVAGARWLAANRLELVLHFGVLLPVAYVCGVMLNGGLLGVWSAAAVYATLLTGLMAWKFRQGSWKTIDI